MTPTTISYEEFHRLVSQRSGALMRAAAFLSLHGPSKDTMTRPLLGELHFQSTLLEEFLDIYGARNNHLWERFRSLTAAIKLFSNVCYELLHIAQSLPAYRLIPVEDDFEQATADTLLFTGRILTEACRRVTDEARHLNLPVPTMQLPAEYFSERLPPGRLPHDLANRKLETVDKTITLLATAFLNLSAECKQALPRGRTKIDKYLCEFTGPVSEEKLRSFELRFHNLQSLYDTYVSTTETEVVDKDLPVLRGHISVVLHLLRTARDYAHHIERHAAIYTPRLPVGRKRLVEPEILLQSMQQYSINFVSQFLTCAEKLCQNMLKRYTEIGRIEVSVPQYRGFHVRPSTLISKLVLHYGSDVRMELDGESYDARSPLELFRANEKINARKRKTLAEQILKLGLVPDKPDDQDMQQIMRNVIMSLAEHSHLIIYEHPLHIEPKPIRRDEKLIEQVTDEIARLQVTGKIDMIANDMKVAFIGDIRVLDDIRLLAQNGYREDNFGNNIPLPDELKYLRE